MSWDTNVVGVLLLSVRNNVDSTDRQWIFTPWHIRCKMDWGTLLPAVLAPVWWQIARIGGRDQRSSGLVIGHTDASHPLCTLQCMKVWWEKNARGDFQSCTIIQNQQQTSKNWERAGVFVLVTCTILSHIHNQVVDSRCSGYCFSKREEQNSEFLCKV